MKPAKPVKAVLPFYRRHRRAILTLQHFTGIDSFTLSAALMLYPIFRKR